MELADPRMLRQMTDAFNAKKVRPRRSDPRMTRTATIVEPVYQAPRHKSRRCECGACRTCTENARWERIFAEKFADPTYYSGPVTRHGSPLHTISSQ
jgi:hypothetical protein